MTSCFPRACFIAWCCLLLWAPLPLGSYWPWAEVLLTLLTALLAAGMLALAIYRGLPLFTLLKPYSLPLGLLFLVPLWASLQLVPVPFAQLQWLSPKAAELWEASGTELGRLTIDVGRTEMLAAFSWALWLFLAMTFLLLDTRERVRTAALLIVCSGVFQALYGSFMTLSGVEYGFFVKKEYYAGVATGTFWSRNQLAGYLGMCLSIGIGLLVGTLNRERSSNWREGMRRLLDSLLGSKIRLRIFLALMVIALVLTRSRMGNTAFFSALCITAVILMVMQRKLHKGALILFASLLLVDFVIVGQWFGFEKLAERVQNSSLEADNIRFQVALETQVLLKDYLFTGSGLGSWTAAFPQYQGPDVRMFYEHAHNDYLQFVSDLGIICMVPLVLLVVFSLGRALFGMYRRKDQLAKGVAFASTMSITALLIHLTVEYNLQMPAIAQLFMVVLAFAWISHTLPRQTGRDSYS